MLLIVAPCLRLVYHLGGPPVPGLPAAWCCRRPASLRAGPALTLRPGGAADGSMAQVSHMFGRDCIEPPGSEEGTGPVDPGQRSLALPVGLRTRFRDPWVGWRIQGPPPRRPQPRSPKLSTEVWRAALNHAVIVGPHARFEGWLRIINLKHNLAGSAELCITEPLRHAPPRANAPARLPGVRGHRLSPVSLPLMNDDAPTGCCIGGNP